MTKLTKEDIQFIDNYLENSDVIYADIRMEMTDHVASEIETLMEADASLYFYDAFKNYMIKNKKNLLNQNKKFVNTITNENAKLIFKELIAFKTILIFIGIAILSYYTLGELNASIIKNIFTIPLFSMIPLVIIYFLSSKILNLDRFSGVERLAFLFGILFQIIHLISIVVRPKITEGIDNIIISVAFTTCIVLIYVFVKVTCKVIRGYILKYKSVV